MNQVTTITKLDIDGTKVTIERDVEGDVEIVETSLPLLVTCQQGLNDPRYRFARNYESKEKAAGNDRF